METTPEFKTTRKAAPAAKAPAKAKAAPKLDREKISAAIALIDAKADAHIDTLVLDLTEDHKLKLPKSKALTFTARMHGIEGSPSPIIRLALKNWANAARRQLLKAEG
ncbi:hypothetical protein [Roseicyclus amphidinii]|uniref:hypothetical protein n=1 Tax=Roseicyclus amphidinii TaxID=3034232 RepID=UPI0024E14A85|nr:hypothetical protein [Roseicyclus sp. Amp-Y-6]